VKLTGWAAIGWALTLVVPATVSAQELSQTIVEVRVHGNYAVPDAEVLELAGVAPGSPLREGDVEAIASRLRLSGRFDWVEVRTRFRSLTRTDEVALVIVVHERPAAAEPNPVLRPFKRVSDSLLFLPILDYAEGYGFTYGVRASTIDLLGAGERLSFPLTWGGEKRAALEAERGFERGPLSRLWASASVLRRENPHFGIDEKRAQVEARVERALPAGLRAGARAAWSHVEFGVADDRYRAAGLDVSFDSGGNPAFPRNALTARAAWTALSGLASATIHRIDLEARGYIGLTGRSVLALSAASRQADHALPAYEKPLLGGGSSLRGHRVGAFAADNLAVASVELRRPLGSPLSAARVGYRIFGDIGAAYDHGAGIRKARFRQGAGAGLFLAAPFLRLNLDLAQDFHGRVRLHFYSAITF